MAGLFRLVVRSFVLLELLDTDDGTTITRNVGNYSPKGRESQDGRPQPTATPLYEYKTCNIHFTWTTTLFFS